MREMAHGLGQTPPGPREDGGEVLGGRGQRQREHRRTPSRPRAGTPVTGSEPRKTLPAFLSFLQTDWPVQHRLHLLSLSVSNPCLTGLTHSRMGPLGDGCCAAPCAPRPAGLSEAASLSLTRTGCPSSVYQAEVRRVEVMSWVLPRSLLVLNSRAALHQALVLQQKPCHHPDP